MRRLYKARQGRMLCGVCAGVGNYFNIDPTIIRLVWLVFGFSGVGVFAYFVAAIVIPEEE